MMDGWVGRIMGRWLEGRRRRAVVGWVGKVGVGGGEGAFQLSTAFLDLNVLHILPFLSTTVYFRSTNYWIGATGLEWIRIQRHGS